MNAMTDPVLLTLACHPQTPSRAIRGVDAVVGTAQGDSLSLTFILQGDLSGIRIPDYRSPRRAGNLWQHTCFEAFAMAEDGPGYREFNFSPSGEWAATAFRGYRDNGEPAVEPGPEIAVRRRRERLELDAEICAQCLPPGRLLRLGLCAVVEDARGELTYWALRHPPGQPDFHHSDAFVLSLELASLPGVDTLAGGMMR